ncbi:MAG: hypothetical protein Q9185_003484 [Variospora sp. 1 TL-2023]
MADEEPYGRKLGMRPRLGLGFDWALLTRDSLAQSEWIIDFEFRATGPDRGGGNLQLWYLKDGRPQVETPSIYTIGAFDGLALTVGDASGATRLAHNVYESDLVADFVMQIKMPSGYFFGVSAASADTPDSFEIYKFVTSSAPGVTRELPKRESPPQQPPPAANPGGQTTDQGTQQASSNGQLAVQFTELQNRLSTLSQSLDNVFREVQSLSAKSDARHQDLTKRVSFNEQLNTMDQKVQSIENTLRDYSGQFSSIRGVLKDSHSTLNEGLTQQMTHIISTKSPRIGTFVVVIIVFQLLLAGIYVVYKRKRANGPKKYL